MGSSSKPRNVTTSGTTNTNTNTSGTTTTQLPDWLTQAGQDQYGILSRLAGGYQAPGINPTLQGAMDQYGRLDPAAMIQEGSGLVSGDRGGTWANTAIQALMGFTGGDAAGGTGSFGGGASTLDRDSIRDVSWRDFTDFDLQKYMNPYTQSVVDSSIGDITRNAEIAALQRGSQLQKAGAFGGSRQSVLDALAGGETSRAIGDVSSRLRADAFDKATGLIGRDQTGAFSADTANQGADLTSAVTNANNATTLAGINASTRSNEQALRLQALQSALSGGINLGSLDVSRGLGLGNLGSGILGNLTQLGGGLQDYARQDALMPFQMQTGVAGLLSSLPYNSTVNQTGTSTSSGTNTGTQPYFQPSQTGQYLGAGATIAAAAIMM